MSVVYTEVAQSECYGVLEYVKMTVDARLNDGGRRERVGGRCLHLTFPHTADYEEVRLDALDSCAAA